MIRKIKLDDIETIYYMGNQYEESFSKKYILEHYIDNASYVLLCYEYDNVIKGWIITTKLYETMEILLIYVDNKYRKQGIATKLLKALESYNVDNILLEVSVENHAALSLYKKLGYNIIAKRPKYYNGIDAHIMKKEIR